MNILILTGRFGMGHYSAAEAVKQEILAKDNSIQVDVVDIIDYMLPLISKSVYGSFNFMVSYCSGVYNLLNQAAGKYKSVPFKRSFIHRMEKLLSQYDPDLLIATLPVCSQYISAYKTMKRCDIPFFTYVTDITAHTEWIAAHTDMYFVGAESTRTSLIEQGVPNERITICGIPVKQAFKAPADCLPHPSGKKEILIMGGGLGLLPSSDKLLAELNTKSFLHVTVITGSNHKLLAKLKKDYPNITALGYTDKVNEYMKQADLVVTKSGGITTFEAIYSETPLYIIKPFLSQETGNAAYIEQNGIGSVLWEKDSDAVHEILSLLQDEAKLTEMKRNMHQILRTIRPASPLYYLEPDKESVLCC